MNKQSFLTILLTMLMSMTGAKAFAHDIEVANSDGVTIYYVWTNNNTELAVSYRGSWSDDFQNEYTGNIVIPRSVDYNGNTYPVTSIGSCAFYHCYGLTSVTIPNSVTTINDHAFENCTGLTSVTIPNSVTSIGDSGFKNCTGLTSVTIPIHVTPIDTPTIPHNLASIGHSAFSGCTDLTSVTIPDNVTSIGDYAFSDCSGLTSVTIPNRVTSIGNYVFKGCSGLTSVTIPNSVTSIGSSAFSRCSGLTSVTIPNSVTSIGVSAFNECSSLTSITIPNSVTSIGWYAFYGCSGLTSVIVKCSPTSIGESPFDGCDKIEEVYFDCETVTSLFRGHSSIKKVTMSDNIKSIGNEALSNCSGLISVIIGSGVTFIGGSAFSGSNLKKTIWLTNTPPSGYSNAAGAVNYVSNDQFSFNNKLMYQYQFLSSYFDVNGIRYVPISPSERTCDAIDCVYDESVANTKISSTVVYKGVTMNVKNIKPYLAYNNKFIKTLTIDNDGELADYAFTDCSNLETVVHGEKINRIGKGAFSGCKALTSLTTSEKTTLSNVISISKNVTTIDDYAFKGCNAIKNIIFMDSDAELKLGVNNFGDRWNNYTGTPLFSDCPLDSVYIGRNIDYNSTKQYGYSPFYSNTSLRAVKITDKETEISENEFYGCTNLQRVVIGDGVTTIGNWAFSGCQSLKYFAFGSQVATIGQEAFSDCAAVIEISSKAKTAPECGAQALDDINKWDCKLYVPDGCMVAYEAADQWKDFFFKEEGEGTAGQGAGAHSDNNKKCETPTITVDGGTIKFDCKTSGVMFHYNISSADAKSDVANSSIEVKNNYTVSVYASKEGYTDSEVAKKSFQVAGAGKKGDVNGDNKVDVADHVELSKIILEQGQ